MPSGWLACSRRRYGWLYMRSRNLWIPIASHAITNGLLGFWILAARDWRLW